MNGKEAVYDAKRLLSVGSDIGLYDDSNLLRIVLECTRLAMEKKEALCVGDFHHLDLLHYEGQEGLHRFCMEMVQPNDQIIDLGSGVGGSSRYMVEHFKAKVVSIEISKKIGGVGETLNLLQHMENEISYKIQDITSLKESMPEWDNHFNSAVSQLCILHIPNKLKLFESIYHLLKPGGTMYVEDFFRKQDFSERERKVLSHDISVPDGTLLSEMDYKLLLEQCGFVVTEWNDKTEKWSRFVWQRNEKLLTDTTPTTTSKLGWFYQQMAFLFYTNSMMEVKDAFPLTMAQVEEVHDGYFDCTESSHLGGVQFIITKPLA